MIRSTGAPVPPAAPGPPPNATVVASTLRRSLRQTKLPPIEMREEQLDGDDEDTNDADDDDDEDEDANDADTDAALSRPAWKARLGELADYRKIHGHSNGPMKSSENPKLTTWVGTQRYQYGLHLKGKTSRMTLSRIQDLERLGFKWDCYGAAWEERLSEFVD
jgi:hypothetical protein